jgi:ribosomal protein L40E
VVNAGPYFFQFRVKREVPMKSCMRCGQKMSHNYLVAIFAMINEKVKRMIVCFKCKEILAKKDNNPA